MRQTGHPAIPAHPPSYNAREKVSFSRVGAGMCRDGGMKCPGIRCGRKYDRPPFNCTCLPCHCEACLIRRLKATFAAIEIR
jgi:hypothetical protein